MASAAATTSSSSSSESALRPTIAIDYGGVCSWHDASENAKTGTMTVDINVPCCLEALEYLRALGYRLVLVSYCETKRATTTHAYLKLLQKQRRKPVFDEVVFVKSRSTKVHVCHLLGASVMIDDRQEVLDTFAPTKITTLLFGGTEPEGQSPHRWMADWDAVTQYLEIERPPAYRPCPGYVNVMAPLVHKVG